MNDAMAHRGPDGEGFWEASPDGRGWGAMLAHRRLSILALERMGFVAHSRKKALNAAA